MSETKIASPQDGLTAKAQLGAKSLQVMKDGEEPPDMLLALLNNALSSMIDCQQAKILGKAKLIHGKRHIVGTIIVVYGVEPDTANSLKMVS